MTTHGNSYPPNDSGERRVISFPGAQPHARPPAVERAPRDALAKYAQSCEAPGEYRHRMMVNAAAFAFVLALIGAAVWLADTMAEMRRGQDCVLSGRRGCAPVEVQKERW